MMKAEEFGARDDRRRARYLTTYINVDQSHSPPCNCAS